MLAIVGESGSGKSVAMLAVMGLLPPIATVTADAMRFEGEDLLALTPRQRRDLSGSEMAMIFQEPVASLNPCFTVGFQIEETLREHTDLGARGPPRPGGRAPDRRSASPSPSERLKSFPHQMSGGQCQRVMIAIATACNPKLLIADEPTTALDVTIQKQILDLLLRLQAEHGMALVLITHDMGVVAETADRVIVQYNGRKMEDTDVVSLFERAEERLHPGAALGAAGERQGRPAADGLGLRRRRGGAANDRASRSSRPAASPATTSPAACSAARARCGR